MNATTFVHRFNGGDGYTMYVSLLPITMLITMKISDSPEFELNNFNLHA